MTIRALFAAFALAFDPEGADVGAISLVVRRRASQLHQQIASLLSLAHAPGGHGAVGAFQLIRRTRQEERVTTRSNEEKVFSRRTLDYGH